MGRYIVLEIDDDECAQQVLDNPPQGAVPIGVFFKASKFCDCTNLQSKDGLLVNNQFVRGTKFGLYVHKVCKRPRAGHQHYLRNLMLEDRIDHGQGLYVGMVQPYVQYRKFGR